MNLLNANLSLLFEIRVANQCAMSAFTAMLTDVANMYLAHIGSSWHYAVHDLTLERRELSKVTLTRKAARRTSSDEECSPFSPGAEQKVGDCFNFLSRSLRCNLHQSEEVDTLPSSPRHCRTGLESLQRFGEYPIRSLQVESLSAENFSAELQEAEVPVTVNRDECCCKIS